MQDSLWFVLSEAIRPDESLNLAEWAEAHRILPEGSAEPGPWSNSRAPYLTLIMITLSPDHPCVEVVVIMGTQMGKTEIGNNWVCYTIGPSPVPMMMVLPTVEMAKDHSKTRIAPTIAAMPELKEKVGDAKSRDSQNAIQMKQFPGGFLHFGGANSAASLSSKPVARIYLDEVDRYPQDADGEGDPVGLAKKRFSNFQSKKIYQSSTPVDEETSRIEPAYERSNKQKYHVPCPHCGALQVLRWESLKYSTDKETKNLIEDSIYYECEACREHIFEHHKTEMLAGGEWIAENPDVVRVQGFWINALYAPIGWISWTELVEEWLECVRTNDQAKLKQFMNTRLAQTWKKPGEKVEHSTLFKRREQYIKIPDTVAVLTAGIDTQDNRFEVTVYGYGRDEESWGVVHEVIAGDTSMPPNLSDPSNVWAKLLAFLDRRFEAENGALLDIWRSCIDTQGHRTAEAAAFLKLPKVKNRRFKIHGISGNPTAKTFLAKPSEENKYKIELFSIGVSIAKETIHARLKMEDHGGGFMHFNEAFGEAFFRQLTSERLVREHNKRGAEVKRWVKPDHVRNEALDCAVYAYAAYGILNPNIEAFLEYNRQMAGSGQFTPNKQESARGGRHVRSEGIKRK